MAKYLVDYENTYIEGLDGLENLTEKDEVCIFYTQNRCGMTFDLHKRFLVSKAAIKLLEVSSAPPKNPYSKTSISNSIKNALDLQLTLYLGYLLASDTVDEEFYIISKDNDFGLDLEFCRTYLEGCDKQVYLFENIQKALDKDIIPSDEETTEETEQKTAESSENEAETSKECENSDSEKTEPENAENKAEKDDQAEETKEKMVLANNPTTTLVVDDKISTGLFSAMETLLKESNVASSGDDFVKDICTLTKKSEDLLALNNNLANLFRDGEKVKAIYHVIKPQFELLKKL
jgi:hypothetical protein